MKRREIEALAERLLARSTSRLSCDQPELQSDLKMAAGLILLLARLSRSTRSPPAILQCSYRAATDRNVRPGPPRRRAPGTFPFPDRLRRWLQHEAGPCAAAVPAAAAALADPRRP